MQRRQGFKTAALHKANQFSRAAILLIQRLLPYGGVCLCFDMRRRLFRQSA